MMKEQFEIINRALTSMESLMNAYGNFFQRDDLRAIQKEIDEAKKAILKIREEQLVRDEVRDEVSENKGEYCFGFYSSK